MSEKIIHVQLNLQESSLLLQALAERPFKLVFDLIGKLNHQAQPFYQPPLTTDKSVRFTLTASEFSLCVKSLGDLPYNQVQGLIANLHSQLMAQAD
jgi:hypothetical protein